MKLFNNMKLFNKQSIAIIGVMFAVSAAPSSAIANDEFHHDAPALSIKVGGHHGNFRKRHHKKRFNSRRNNFSKGYRYNKGFKNSYSNGFKNRSYKRNYRKKRNNYYYNNYQSRDYYNKKRRRNYNGNYYNNGSNYNDSGYNNRSGRSNYCPIAGYSSGLDDNRSCYEHKDHFHCE